MVSLRCAIDIWSFRTINVYFRTQNSSLKTDLKYFGTNYSEMCYMSAFQCRYQVKSVLSPSLSISKTLRNTLVDVSLRFSSERTILYCPEQVTGPYAPT